MKRIIFIGILIKLVLLTGIASAQRLSVSAPLANIRSGPGTTYDILWKVEKFHPILVLKKTGKWYYFRDFEGDEGWIYSALVQNLRAVITRVETCNIRSGPGISFQILFTVGKGIPFKVLEKKGNWYHIQHADGDKGWIHDSLVW